MSRQPRSSSSSAKTHPLATPTRELFDEKSQDSSPTQANTQETKANESLSRPMSSDLESLVSDLSKLTEERDAVIEMIKKSQSRGTPHKKLDKKLSGLDAQIEELNQKIEQKKKEAKIEEKNADIPHPASLPIMISIFNQKGGVGKTTSTYELGYSLHKMGFRVLMIDADPQGSLTAIINPEHSTDKNKADKFNQKLEENKRADKYSKIDDIFEPSLGILRQESVTVERAKKVEILQVHKYQNLFYIPGSVKFGRINKVITLGINNVPGTQAFADMVPNVLRAIGKEQKCDIILIDLNPGIDGLNQSIIMKSDYVLMPFKPSLGCLDSVKNLIEVFPEWFDSLRTSKILQQNEGPLFLGTFPQIMRLRTDKKTKVEKLEVAYETWIKNIFSISKNLLDQFKSHMPSQQDVPLDRYKDRIGIRDMVGAGLNAQMSGHPMSDVNYPHEVVERNGKRRYFSVVEKKRKVVNYRSYRKIIGVFFAFLQKEHRDALSKKVPNFLETVNLYGSLDDAFELDSAHSKKSNEIASTQKKRKKRDTSWYTNDDLTSLLEHYTASDPGYFFTTPMQGDGKFSEKDLTNNIKTYLLEHIVDITVRKRTIFIPLNVGAAGQSNKSGNHWTIAIIRYDKNTGMEEIFYFDPLGSAIPVNANNGLIKAINEVFGTKISSIETLEGLGAVQTDGYNCGPWIIEAARSIIEQRDLQSLKDLDISEKRNEHRAVIASNNSASSNKKQKAQEKNKKDKSNVSQKEVTRPTSQSISGILSRPSSPALFSASSRTQRSQSDTRHEGSMSARKQGGLSRGQ